MRKQETDLSRLAVRQSFTDTGGSMVVVLFIPYVNDLLNITIYLREQRAGSTDKQQQQSITD